MCWWIVAAFHGEFELQFFGKALKSTGFAQELPGLVLSLAEASEARK
jgi:hypothetical protein